LAGPSEAYVYLALVHAYMGMKEESMKVLAKAEAEFPGGQSTPYEIAVVWFKLGDAERGFEWLEKAYEHHDRYVFMMAITRELEGVRDDPRYRSLLKKTGLEGLVRS
jgi:tetratricopeptide (TPR) repeat protein